MKVTIDIDPDLYRAVKVEAARGDRSVRAIVDEALAAWLESAETEEDRASAEAALVEYRRDGGEAAGFVLRVVGRRDPGDLRSGRGVSEGDRRVELAPAAQRQLRRLPPGDAARLRGPILALAMEPRPPGTVKLAGTEFWRLRVGDLRVIYVVDDAAGLGDRPQGRATFGEHLPTDVLTA